MKHKHKKDMLVQSNPLIEARKPMNTLESRLFYIALQDVNPHLSKNDKFYDKEFKETILTPMEVKQVFGGRGEYLRLADLACDELTKRRVVLKGEDGSFTYVPIFAIAEYKPNKGLRLGFNSKMRPFLLDIFESGYAYTKISMKQIFNLSSAYAMRLLELMLQYRGLMKNKQIVREITLEDLRFRLNVPDKSYPAISDFKRYVLNVGQREINQKTQYSLTYKDIKTGRKITSFIFTLDCSDVVVDKKFTKTITLEMNPPKKEWHGLSENAVNKLITICGNNEEFKKRMDYALSLLPKRKPKNPQAFLYKAIEENYLQQELDMQEAIKKEMKATEEWKDKAKERFKDAIELEDGAPEIPFDKTDQMQKAMVSVIKTSLQRLELDYTSQRLLTEHGYTVARFIDIYCD